MMYRVERSGDTQAVHSRDCNAHKTDLVGVREGVDRSSIPMPQLPFTTMICEIADKVVRETHGGDIDISNMWKVNGFDGHIQSDL